MSSGLPAVTTATAYNGGARSYAFDSANTAGATTSGATTNPINVDINQYPMLGFAVKSASGGMGVGFQIQDNNTNVKTWLVYTFGGLTLSDPAKVTVALPGDASNWLAAVGSSSSQLNVWSQVVNDPNSRFGGRKR